MPYNWSHLLIALFCFSFVACAEDTRQSVSDKAELYYGIVGGQKVIEGSEFAKRTVLLRTPVKGSSGFSSDYDICTGTVLAPNIILTAAHCVLVDISKMEVAFTESIQDIKIAMTKVEAVSIHSSYAGNTQIDLEEKVIDSDIALVKIQGVVPSHYIPVSIASMPETPEKFGFAALGFGNNTGILNLPAGTDLGAGILRVASTVGLAYDHDKNFFISDHTLGAGACFGDSGGPALIKEGEEYKIIGVTRAIFSRNEVVKAKDADHCKYNGIYMSVPYYQDWIERTIQKLNGLGTPAL